ncbi:MAG TPA: ABC transporter permease [Desulfohalobiaceae bacterium]|nr:ABC transporter permease [Desulfohalobiaceae bacterium]
MLLPKSSRLFSIGLVLRQNKLACLGGFIFVLFFVTAIIGAFLTAGKDPVMDPSQVRLQEKLRPPLTQADLKVLSCKQSPFFGVYIFGTDNLGRDVLARMLQGAWVSLTVGFVAVGIAVFIGIIMGGLAGYFGPKNLSGSHILTSLLVIAIIISLHFSSFYWALILTSCIALLQIILYFEDKNLWPKLFKYLTCILNTWGISIDTIVMRFVDIMLCFPSFFLILTVIALLPASIYNIMIVIGLTSWMGTARFVRAEFLSLREQEFVTAAKALGLGDLRIIIKHLLPNAIAPVLVSATIGIATAILTEAGLSFLGFGVPPPQATWGNILSEGKRFLFDAPWLTLIPGTAILVVVLAFNLFGEGLRDALNPQLRNY